MNPEFLDDEMRALLSAYSMGTLTAAERKRLFEKALGNQSVFNEMMDEESLRAAIESPLVKRALKNALEKAEIPQPAERDNHAFASAAAPAPMSSGEVEPKSNRGVWMASVACLLVATLGLYTFFKPGVPTVEVAQAPPPARPVAEEPQLSVKQVAAPPAAPRERKAANPPVVGPESEGPAKKEILAEADTQSVRSSVAAQPIAIASLPPPPPSASAPPANPLGAGLGGAAPKPAEQTMVMALRDEAKSVAASKFEARAKFARRQDASAPIRLVNRQIILESGLVGHLYAYRRDPSGYIKVLSIAITKDSPHTLAAPTGQISIFLSPQADPELDALEKVAILPVRIWTQWIVN